MKFFAVAFCFLVAISLATCATVTVTETNADGDFAIEAANVLEKVWDAYLTNENKLRYWSEGLNALDESYTWYTTTNSVGVWVPEDAIVVHCLVLDGLIVQSFYAASSLVCSDD